MFIEPQLHIKKRGWIEVICGSMFSGKTEELIRRLKRAEYAGLNVEIFKPLVDTRYSDKQVVSHNKNAIHSTPISSSSELYMLTENIDVVGIDEAQFFDDEIVVVLEKLALRGVRIIVAGLDMDYLGKPFGPMPQLLAVAEYVTKLHAICMDCGALASRSHRIVYDNDEQVLLGEKDAYEPLCRTCYNEKIKRESQNTSSD